MNTEKKRLIGLLNLSIGHGLARVGTALLDNERLREEAIDYCEALLASKPKSELSEEDEMLAVMLMGVALGLGLADNEAKVEKVGGFDTLIQQMKDEGFQSVVDSIKDKL